MSASAATMPAPIVVESDITFASRYVFRGVQNAGNSFQPTVQASLGDLYGGVWANLPTGEGLRELHYFAGSMIALPDVRFAVLDAGLTVYHFPGAGEDRTHELYFGAQFPGLGLPNIFATLYYYYDLDVQSHVVEATGTYSYSLEGWGLPASADLSVRGGIQSGRDAQDYRFYGAAAELPFALGESSLVTAGVRWETAERFAFGPGQRGQTFFWTLSYRAGF